MIEGPGTILGGLPVIAIIEHGKDADTPNGPGEYWSEAQAIHWRKRDGSKGKEIPERVRDRAEKYDSYFSCLIEQVEEHFHYEKWKAAQAAKVDGHAERGDNLLAPFMTSAVVAPSDDSPQSPPTPPHHSLGE